MHSHFGLATRTSVSATVLPEASLIRWTLQVYHLYVTKDFGKTRPKFWDEVGGYFEAQAWSRPVSAFFFSASEL